MAEDTEISPKQFLEGFINSDFLDKMCDVSIVYRYKGMSYFLVAHSGVSDHFGVIGHLQSAINGIHETKGRKWTGDSIEALCDAVSEVVDHVQKLEEKSVT